MLNEWRENKMVNLNKETIEVIHKISELLKETDFYVNEFKVAETGAEGMMINIDLRQHNGKKKI